MLGEANSSGYLLVKKCWLLSLSRALVASGRGLQTSTSSKCQKFDYAYETSLTLAITISELECVDYLMSCCSVVAPALNLFQMLETCPLG